MWEDAQGEDTVVGAVASGRGRPFVGTGRQRPTDVSAVRAVETLDPGTPHPGVRNLGHRTACQRPSLCSWGESGRY